MNICGVLVCAGFSSIMGRIKSLLPYKGLPFAVQIIRKMSLVCNKIIVVTGFESDKIKTEIIKELQILDKNTQSNLIGKTEFVFNRHLEREVFSSLRFGLKSADDADWILFHFIEQPTLPEEFYLRFIDQLDENFNWLQPSYLVRMHAEHILKAGHPIFLKKDLFSHIINAGQDETLQEFKGRDIVKLKIWECNFAEILQYIDNPEEYKQINEK